jgi:hypothetical protein
MQQYSQSVFLRHDEEQLIHLKAFTNSYDMLKWLEGLDKCLET